MFCGKCGKRNPEDAVHCAKRGERMKKSEFTPEDLKEVYPGKYDNWLFYKTGRGDWIGRPKEGGEVKRIESKSDVEGNAVPCLVDVKIDSTGSHGIQVWTRALKSFLKKK